MRASLLLLLGAGCAAVSPRPAASEDKPPITVAVIGFGGTNAAASGAERGCVMAVLDAGFRAAERWQILTALPDENDIDFTNFGRLLNADLIIDGGVVRGSETVPARLEPRLISSHSAAVLASARSKGRVKLSDDIGQKLCSELLAQLP